MKILKGCEKSVTCLSGIIHVQRRNTIDIECPMPRKRVGEMSVCLATEGKI